MTPDLAARAPRLRAEVDRRDKPVTGGHLGAALEVLYVRCGGPGR